MNVIISNERQNELTGLDIDIIKSLTGSFEVQEIVEMFKNFFFSKMILDVTAMKGYTEIGTYEALIGGLDKDKIIFLLPAGSNLCTPNFLSRLITLGIYNFTIDLNGIKYLLRKPNTFQDVEHIQKMVTSQQNIITTDNNPSSTIVPSTSISNVVDINKGANVIGFKNVTAHAGATSFIYILKKELCSLYGNDKVVAIEINRGDFFLFGDQFMISAREADISSVMSKYKGVDIFLIDLNDCTNTEFCKDIVYLLEPGTIKINKLVRKGANVFKDLANKKVVLNQSLLVGKDVTDFESETGIKVFYNMPPLDDRRKNDAMNDFLVKMGLGNRFSGGNGTSNKGFGLFRK